MIEVVRQIAAALSIPMHFLTEERLQSFLDRLGPTHDIIMNGGPSARIARETLSRGRPAVMMLTGH